MESYTLPNEAFKRSPREGQPVVTQARREEAPVPSEAARELVAALITLAIAQKGAQRRPN